MKNVEHFGDLTPRMNSFREAVLDKKPYIDATRALLVTEAYKKHQNQPAVMKRALMLKNILEKMPIYIEDETLIVGNQASSNKDAPIFPEYTMKFVIDELDLFEKRDGDVFYITEDTKEALRSIAPFWENNNLRAKGEALLPDEVSVFMETGFFGMEGKLNSGDAHLAVDYQNVLENGLVSYENRVLKLKADLDLCKPENIDKYHFYKAVLIVIESVKTFAARFSELAKKQAENASGKRKDELLEISRICKKVPYFKAETFKEAIQSVWFIQLILQIESNGHSLSYGRFDQYMYPYLKHDLENGILSEDDVVELLNNLWIKTLTINKVLNNDEVIIPSFIEKGVKEEDAYDYSAIGCVETAVPGKWGYRCTGMSYMNFPRILLIAMNNGVDMTSGKRFVEECGYFTEMDSYEDLMNAWDKVVRQLTRMSVIVENAIDLASERDVPDVLCSTLTNDCIGRGKTIKEGGAIYDYISGLQVGIANMADSLAAIKKLVFEEKKITKQQLWDALLDNFTSEENQKIQKMLINEAPKYGNDDDYVDQLVVEAYDSYIDEMKKYPNTRYGRGPIGGIRYAGTSSISANVGQGFSTMATPDGRKAQTPLAEGCSPAHSCDKSGPTAVFKSVSKLPTHEITGGVLLNQKVTPQMLSSDENKQKLEMLIKTFFNRLEGYHVQYNVVSRETLIDAQKHPEKHKDLIVRVAGYSAFFNVLSKATQDDIIERTEQTL